MLPNLGLNARTLMMLLTQQCTLVESLLARRNIQCRILIEEIHRLQMHLDDLARHDREILDTRDMVDTKLDPDDNILVENVVLAISPCPHTVAATGLISVGSAGIELVRSVFCDVDVVVCEFGAFVVEGGRVREHLLEIRRHNFVGNGFVIDGVAYGGGLDFEETIGVAVQVQTGRCSDGGFSDHVACSERVEVIDWHGVRLVVHQAVLRSFDVGVNAEREDVLVVSGQDARVNNGTPGNVDAFIDRLSGKNTRGADFISEFTGLIEHEGHDVFVVGNGDDALENEFTVARDCGTASTVVCVLPANAVVLFVDADNIGHVDRSTRIISKNAGEVMNRAKAVAAELEVVRHVASADITEIES